MCAVLPKKLRMLLQPHLGDMMTTTASFGASFAALLQNKGERIKTVFSVTTMMEGTYVTGIVLPSLVPEKAATMLPGEPPMSMSIPGGIARNFVTAIQLPEGTSLPFLPGECVHVRMHVHMLSSS